MPRKPLTHHRLFTEPPSELEKAKPGDRVSRLSEALKLEWSLAKARYALLAGRANICIETDGTAPWDTPRSRKEPWPHSSMTDIRFYFAPKQPLRDGSVTVYEDRWEEPGHWRRAAIVRSGVHVVWTGRAQQARWFPRVAGVLAALIDPAVRVWPKGVRVFAAAHCARCSRELSDPHSKERGIGPECWDVVQEWPAVAALKAILDSQPQAVVEAAWHRQCERLVELGWIK